MRRDCPPHREARSRARRGGRRSLQFRLFAWAGATILLTGIVCGLAAWLTSTGPPPFHRTMHGAMVLASRRFAEVWADDRARAALADEFARELQVGVTTRDAEGVALESFGPTSKRPYATIPVLIEGTRGGTVEVFATRFRGLREVVIPLLVALGVLWALSGLLARRLARPLADLASTAQAIGRGELDRRTRVARHAPREVAQVAEALDDMAGLIQRQMADQRELLAAVSHEVRSPLARIRLLVELARPDAERDHALGEIEREVEEIDALVGSLLASSRLDFGTLDPREVDPEAACRDALLRTSLSPDRLEVVGPLPALQADPTLLARALANLLDNARLHGGGVARLRVSTRPGAVQFDVEDDGPGLGEDADKLFMAFRRKPGTHGALGLGLAIVARIAEAHRGGAFAEDRPEGGSRIGFWMAASAENGAEPPGVG